MGTLDGRPLRRARASRSSGRVAGRGLAVTLAGALLALSLAGPAVAVGRARSADRGSRRDRHSQTGGDDIADPYLTLQTRDGQPAFPWQQWPDQSSGLVSALDQDSGTDQNSGTAVALTTTGTSAGPNAASQCTTTWVNEPYAYAGWSPTDNAPVQGQSTWYHVSMDLPSGAYAPTTGEWNWLVEWHNDPHTGASGAQPVSIALGIYTDWPVVAGQVGANPQLVLRLAGGSSADPTYENVYLPGPVQYDHWYSLTFHFVWSTDPAAGLAEWFVDGRQITSQSFPTLFANPDGTQSYNSFGVYNYHLSAPWTSTVEFDNVAIGPSQASVGG
jgi:hypothetical protein